MKIHIKFLMLILLFPLFLWGCGQDATVEKPITPLFKAIQVGNVSNAVGTSFTGKASAAREANLSFRVSGPLIHFPVKVGDKVRKGDLLARIDPRDFEVRLNNVKGQFERTIAALNLAEIEYNRVQKIWRQDSGAVSETMLDQNREIYNQTKAEMQSLEASVAAAKDALSYTLLRAPFTGTVVETFVENYEDVQAKSPVVRLIDIARIEFKVDIPESYISLIPKVERVSIRFDVYPVNELPARIKEIGKEASKTTRTYPVTLIMEQPGDFRIYPGMAGCARFYNRPAFGGADSAISIPLSALFKGQGEKDCVWVIDTERETVSRRQVKLGALTRDGVMVLEGLMPGEWIVAAGSNSLQEGKSVRILRSEKPAAN